MKLWKLTAALAALSTPVAAMAGFSGTLTVTSDYDWRGFSQTAEDPAIQGSVDFEHSGFYVGIWASNVDFGDASDADFEVDYYGGYGGSFGESGAGWDVGILAYTYTNDSSLNWTEFHVGFSLAGFSTTLNYSDDYLAVGDSGWYWSNDFSYEWDNGWSYFIHAGYSTGDAFDNPFNAGASDYWDWSGGVGYTYGNLYIEAKLIDTSNSGRWEIDSGVGANDLRAIVSMSLSIP